MCKVVASLPLPRSWRQPVRVLFLCALVLAGVVTRADSARYEIDPEHVTVAFLVDHLGYAKVLGRFREVTGAYRFDDETGELSDVLVTVDTATVFTDHERRDEHLRSKDFLDAPKFPTMTFTGTKVERAGENIYRVTGNLKLLGVTLPLTLTASWNKSARHPIELWKYVMGVSARGSLKRSEFGMTYAVANGWVGDTVEILIEFEARRR